MRKVLVLLVALAALAASATPARAAPVTGTMATAGTLAILDGAAPCRYFRHEQWGTVGLDLFGVASATLDFCSVPNNGWPDVIIGVTIDEGTFELALPTGTMSGRVSGLGSLLEDSAGRFPLELTLSVDRGTGLFLGATGHVLMDGSFGPGALSIAGDTSGDIALASVPSSPADCRHGGWRTATNDVGEPFTDQRACTSFVRAR